MMATASFIPASFVPCKRAIFTISFDFRAGTRVPSRGRICRIPKVWRLPSSTESQWGVGKMEFVYFKTDDVVAAKNAAQLLPEGRTYSIDNKWSVRADKPHTTG